MFHHQEILSSAALCIGVSLLFVTTVEGSCRYINIREKKGELYTPDFPSHFSSDICIKWIFHKQYGEVVTISFLVLDLPEGEFGACFSSYVEIITSTVHKVICGKSAVPFTTSPEDTQFSLLFFSGSHPGGHGFHISYLIGPAVSTSCPAGQFHCEHGMCILDTWRCNNQAECIDNSDEVNCTDSAKAYQQLSIQSSPSSLTTTTTSPTTTPRYFGWADDHGFYGNHCSAVLRNTTGQINLRIPAKERGPPVCQWLIAVGENAGRIKLRFVQLDFPQGDRAYVSVYDGYRPYIKNYLGMFSASNHVDSVTSWTNAMLIFFHNDVGGADEDLVFSAHYTALGGFHPTYQPTHKPRTTKMPWPFQHPTYQPPSDCYQRLSRSEGNFTMPPPAFSDASELPDCTWLIHKPTSGSFIHLFFTSVHLQNFAEVAIFDGISSEAPVLGKFTSGQSVSGPMSMRSSGRNLLIKFYSPPPRYEGLPRAGIQFKASYHFEDRCNTTHARRCGPEDDLCYSADLHRCDGTWHCPLSGTDEAGCYGCPSDFFSCNDFNSRTSIKCYSKRDRCNGGSVCSNYADELNCNKDLCSDSNLFLCANKQCILKEFVCDNSYDCYDGSDEKGCNEVAEAAVSSDSDDSTQKVTRRGGSRYIITWAVGGSLVGALVLVLSIGIACKMIIRLHNRNHPHGHNHHHHHHHRSGSRYDTPLTRQQAEMFRRRAPPPPYHEAMVTSRPYDEVVREYLAVQAQLAQQQPQVAATEAEESQGRGEPNPNPPVAASGEAATADSTDQSVHNLISLMDFEDADEHRQLNGGQNRLVIRVTDEASSDSDSDNDENEVDDDNDGGGDSGPRLAEDGSGHIEMSDNLGRGATTSSHRRGDDGDGETESILLENISQDSASTTLSANSSVDSVSLAGETLPEDSGHPENGSSSPSRDDDGEDEESDKDSDSDSVCILCLDDDPAAPDDGTDTRCLLEEV